MSGKRPEYVIVVPQKALRLAKTRLSSVLSREAKIELTLLMLRHTLAVCAELTDRAGIFLCGPPELEDLARDYGATLMPGGSKGLRHEVALAAEDWRIAGRAAMLVVSSDLPLLTSDDLRGVVQSWRQCADVVLCPDRRMRGTNVIMVNIPEAFPFAFGSVVGPGSYEIHLAQAQGTGLRAEVVESEGLSLDIDLPEDLAYLIHTHPSHPVAEFAKARFHAEFRFE
ncbi:MAG: 2-phospho-L-lactate guanylyltransferase [Armatimonadetes bacterium]|nr:2-phospho-L-lactate guanylyltransferase [Armatimonadota bacterium]